MKTIFFVGCLAMPFIACGPRPTKYYWGEYEELVYKNYSKPGSVSPEEQADKLSRDIEIARGKGRPVPPGIHAHLAFVQVELGKLDQAISNFNAEKSLFPESAPFMDRLLGNLMKAKEGGK